jgi:hypothetical protein
MFLITLLITLKTVTFFMSKALENKLFVISIKSLNNLKEGFFQLPYSLIFVFLV